MSTKQTTPMGCGGSAAPKGSHSKNVGFAHHCPPAARRERGGDSQQLPSCWSPSFSLAQPQVANGGSLTPPPPQLPLTCCAQCGGGQHQEGFPLGRRRHSAAGGERARLPGQAAHCRGLGEKGHSDCCPGSPLPHFQTSPGCRLLLGVLRRNRGAPGWVCRVGEQSSLHPAF